MSFKSSTSEWVRKGPLQAMAVVAAVTFVLAGLIGLGVGYKVEQSRTTSDANKLRDQLKEARAKKPAPASTTGAARQRVGKVTATSSNSITMLTKLHGSQVLTTSSSTVYEKAVKATVASVTAGSRVLVVKGGSEVLVLGSSSKLGRVVKRVGDKVITVSAGNGAPAGTVKKASVKTVSILQPATSADVKVGSSALAGGTLTGTTFNATEVIVLLRGSGFAT